MSYVPQLSTNTYWSTRRHMVWWEAEVRSHKYGTVNLWDRTGYHSGKQMPTLLFSDCLWRRPVLDTSAHKKLTISVLLRTDVQATLVRFLDTTQCHSHWESRYRSEIQSDLTCFRSYYHRKLLCIFYLIYFRWYIFTVTSWKLLFGLNKSRKKEK